MRALASSHPRAALTASRVLQGVASFGFAAAAAGGLAAATITLAVGSVIGIVGALAARSLGTLPRLLRDRTVVAASLVGAVALLLGAQAYQLTSVATVSFLLLLVPLFAGLLAPLYGEHLGRRELLGLAISLVGIGCFARPSPAFATEWTGIVLALLTGLALGIVWHQSRSLAQRGAEPWAMTAAQMVVPGVVGLVVVVAMLGRLPGGPALAWLVVSGVGYAGNTVLRLTGLRLLSASKAALIAPVSALTSTALAFVLLDQVPDLLTCIGAVVIVLGVVVSQWPSSDPSSRL
ncbi:MAG: EamA family transporter [Candidatus Nanopelagicales bacterium]